MQRQPIRSSLLKSVGYDASTQILEIEFAKGENVYQYLNVPQETFDAFMAAESQGKYYLGSIKNAFQFRKIEPR